jgi:flagellar basal-body rod protein FlgB
MKLFDATLTTLERALDARALRHGVLAGNLANANTPGFTPREVDFAAAMAQADAGRGAPSSPGPALAAPPTEIPLSAADLRLGLPGASGGPGSPGSPIVAATGTAAGLDGNAVDVDRALVAVAENALQYGAAARAAGKKLAILRYAATDGVG